MNQEIINKLNEAFLPKNLECDGASCTGCWKDVIREAIKMLENEKEIKLISKTKS
jgi:hypothetical protein